MRLSRDTKQELIFIGIAVIMLAFYPLLFMFEPTIDRVLAPPLQFIIFGVGVYLLWDVLIRGVSLGFKLNHFPKFGLALGNMFGTLGIDLIFPEYHVTQAGELIKGGLFGRASTDYFFGWIFSHIGAEGLLLHYLTYIGGFIILFGISALLVGNAIKRR